MVRLFQSIFEVHYLIYSYARRGFYAIYGKIYSNLGGCGREMVT